MKRIKRVILSLLLSKNERVMLWNSLWFSNHTYRRRGNVDGAAAVQIVMNNLEHVLGVTKQKFTHEEVQKIVNDTIEEAVKKSGSIISKVAEESGESKDTESSEKTEEQAPKTSEPVSEAERLRAEDDGVNYEKESSDSQ